MKQIVEYSNWGWIDRLDGQDLEDGEQILIHWPDDTILRETVVLVRTEETIMEMGRPYSTTRSKAYVKRTIHGVAVKVPIVGLMAERIED